MHRQHQAHRAAHHIISLALLLCISPFLSLSSLPSLRSEWKCTSNTRKRSRSTAKRPARRRKSRLSRTMLSACLQSMRNIETLSRFVSVFVSVWLCVCVCVCVVVSERSGLEHTLARTYTVVDTLQGSVRSTHSHTLTHRSNVATRTNTSFA